MDFAKATAILQTNDRNKIVLEKASASPGIKKYVNGHFLDILWHFIFYMLSGMGRGRWSQMHFKLVKT